MKTLRHFLSESLLPFDKNPKIGWWRDSDHVTLYHGTHDKNVEGIKKHGLKAPESGKTEGRISMALEPHTAHAYASMSGGESNFRAAGQKAQQTPHEHRSVMVYRVPRAWVDKHHDPHLRGNTDDVRHHLSDKSSYEKHAAAGKADHQHYEKTELQFKSVPNRFLVGHMKKY